MIMPQYLRKPYKDSRSKGNLWQSKASEALEPPTRSMKAPARDNTRSNLLNLAKLACHLKDLVWLLPRAFIRLKKNPLEAAKATISTLMLENLISWRSVTQSSLTTSKLKSISCHYLWRLIVLGTVSWSHKMSLTFKSKGDQATWRHVMQLIGFQLRFRWNALPSKQFIKAKKVQEMKRS